MVSVSRKTAFLGLFLVICLSILLCASAASSTANLKAQAKVSVLPDPYSDRETLSCTCTAAQKRGYIYLAAVPQAFLLLLRHRQLDGR